jgi:hypothetical protein
MPSSDTVSHFCVSDEQASMTAIGNTSATNFFNLRILTSPEIRLLQQSVIVNAKLKENELRPNLKFSARLCVISSVILCRYFR